MFQQFRVLTDKARRRGQRLQDVVLFDEAGAPFALGGKTDRAIYGASLTVADNGSISWSSTPNDSYGRPLLDFTNPTAPTVLIGGVYAVGLWMQCPDVHAGKHARVDFELDAGGMDATFESEFSLDAPSAGQLPTFTQQAVWYIPQGGSLFAVLNHDVGSAISLNARLQIQLISEA